MLTTLCTVKEKEETNMLRNISDNKVKWGNTNKVIYENVCVRVYAVSHVPHR